MTGMTKAMVQGTMREPPPVSGEASEGTLQIYLTFSPGVCILTVFAHSLEGGNYLVFSSVCFVLSSVVYGLQVLVFGSPRLHF